MDVYKLENKCLGTFFTLAHKIMDSIQQAQNLDHVVADIMNHWIACNIYTVTHKSVREKLEMSTTYTILKKHTAKKKGETFSNNLKHFTKECESLFHIKNRQKT